MHIPDGFIDGRTSLAGGAVAAGGVAVCLRRTAQVLDDRQVPMVGLTAAFVFAVQMLNFPVAAGTSGHLLGGVLAAVLVGPWAGALAVTVVLVVQSFLFADGGLSALGLNIINMALVGALAGYAVFVVLRTLLPRTKGALVLAAGIAAALAPVMASIAFTLEYAIGGNGATSVRTVATAMIGVHVLIGIGEGVITAMTLAAVLATRPDLVHGAKLLEAHGRQAARPCRTGRGNVVTRRASFRAFIAAGFLVALLLAFLVSPHASSSPDGLDKVGAEHGLDTEVRAQVMAGGPLADYRVDGIHDHGLSTGVAGIIGVTITFGAAFGISRLARASRSRALADNSAG